MTPFADKNLQNSLARRLTRKARSNLAMSFFSLSSEKRQAMEVFYAFCRSVDDIADDEGASTESRREQLAQWQTWISEMYITEPSDALAAALSDVVKKYFIPPEYLRDIVRGVEMDLDKTRYANWKELEQYCYRVASCVGLVSIEIFGYCHSSTRQYAKLLGLALQTTNILRDVWTDLQKDRIYLPEEDFLACGTTSDILHKTDPESLKVLRSVLHKTVLRSQYFYAAAERALHEDDRPNMVAAQVMSAVYQKLLTLLKSKNFPGLTSAYKLPRLTKAITAYAAYREEKSTNTKRVRPRSRHVVVVGAGAAGLAAATFLAREGHRVTLIESRATAGGRTHSWPDAKLGITVDNGQHVLMGCYHQTLDWITSLGADYLLPSQRHLDVCYTQEGGVRSRLRASQWMPSPTHLICAIFDFEALNNSEKIETSRVILSARNKEGKWRGQTIAGWLADCKQSYRAITRLWEPVAVAALNEPISTGSAELFRNVILEAFTGHATHSAVIIPRSGLTQLYVNPTLDFLQFTGSTIITGSAVSGINCQNRKVTHVILRNGSRIECDAVILATPWYATAALLRESHPSLSEKIAHLSASPIVCIHLTVEEELFSEPYLGFYSSPLQWIFHLNKTQDIPSQFNHHYTITISAAYREVDLSREELLALAIKELEKFFPEHSPINPLQSFVYKARQATFAATPDNLPFRPKCEEPDTNLFLAGGWTDTGLPDTIEGAVRSAKKAVLAIEDFFNK